MNFKENQQPFLLKVQRSLEREFAKIFENNYFDNLFGFKINEPSIPKDNPARIGVRCFFLYLKPKFEGYFSKARFFVYLNEPKPSSTYNLVISMPEEALEDQDERIRINRVKDQLHELLPKISLYSSLDNILKKVQETGSK